MVGQSDRRDGVREASTRSDQGSQQVGVTILSFFFLPFLLLVEDGIDPWVHTSGLKAGLATMEKERRKNVENRSCPASAATDWTLQTRDGSSGLRVG
jgi:hypothetical protein